MKWNIFGKNEDYETKSQQIEGISNPNDLKDIALNDSDYRIRLRAMGKISDEKFLKVLHLRIPIEMSRFLQLKISKIRITWKILPKTTRTVM